MALLHTAITKLIRILMLLSLINSLLKKRTSENIAMNVIAEYKSKLTEHINVTIYNELTDGLDTYLKYNIKKNRHN